MCRMILAIRLSRLRPNSSDRLSSSFVSPFFIFSLFNLFIWFLNSIAKSRFFFLIVLIATKSISLIDTAPYSLKQLIEMYWLYPNIWWLRKSFSWSPHAFSKFDKRRVPWSSFIDRICWLWSSAKASYLLGSLSMKWVFSILMIIQVFLLISFQRLKLS